MNFKCKKCNGDCKPSQALNNTLVSMDDFGNDANSRGTTQSRVGTAEMVDCQKCENCGHSFVPNEFIEVNINISDINISDILGFPTNNESLHMKWWNSLSDGFDTNSKFQQMHCYLNSNKMDGFSSEDGRTLDSLIDNEIFSMWKNMLCLSAYGTPMSKNTKDDISFIVREEYKRIDWLNSKKSEKMVKLKDEKIITDFFNSKYRGKLADANESLRLAIELLADFQKETKTDVYNNMQHYHEYLLKNEYISPKEWIETKTNF